MTNHAQRHAALFKADGESTDIAEVQLIKAYREKRRFRMDSPDRPPVGEPDWRPWLEMHVRADAAFDAALVPVKAAAWVIVVLGVVGAMLYGAIHQSLHPSDASQCQEQLKQINEHRMYPLDSEVCSNPDWRSVLAG